MREISILVACHKQADVFSNDVYNPIHVGKALHPECDLGFGGDDSGDNISRKNPFYCELTAQYWAWKNLDCEVVGLSHYRRYFEDLDSKEKVLKALNGYDIILPSPITWYCNLENKLTRELTLEDVAIFYKVLVKMYPEYEKTTINYLYGFHFIGYNMFITNKKLFNKYAEFQFGILSECEKYIRLSDYCRLRRIFGYFAEYLLPIYCIHNNLRINYVNVVPFMGLKSETPFLLKKKIQYLLNVYLPTVRKPKSLNDIINSTTELALSSDQIII